MNAQFRKLLIIEVLIFIYSIICLIFSLSDYVFLGLTLVLTVGVCFFTKIDNRNQRFHLDYILLILISVIAYYILTYFSGFFVGFVYSTYSRRFLGIVRNIVISSILIFEVEFMRERIVKGGIYYRSILILAVLVFSLLELEQLFSINVFNSSTYFLEFFLSVFVPLVLKNVMLVFLCFYSNKTITILYQLLMSIPTYILGVFPNLGDYINATLLTIFPLIIMFFTLKVKDIKREKIENGRTIIKRKRMVMVVWTFCMIFTAFLLYLVSGIGRYYLMAIGSDSMTGVINKGDAVIIDKNAKTFKKGQVIAFKIEGKTIVHRIIKIEIDEYGTHYRTKGDYNNSEDGWLVDESNIVGSCLLKIPWIGWPSVLLGELISG